MPGWVQIVIAIASALTAMGIIWSKLIKPGAKVISQAEVTIPIVTKLAKEWDKVPNAPSILAEIAEEFKSDHGSTLKDAIVRLEAAAARNEVAIAEAKRVAVDLRMEHEVARALQDNDRRIMDKLVSMVNVLDARVRIGVQGVANIQDEQHGVAGDLAAAIERADAEDRKIFGSSADAALRSTEQQKKDTSDRHPPLDLESFS